MKEILFNVLKWICAILAALSLLFLFTGISEKDLGLIIFSICIIAAFTIAFVYLHKKYGRKKIKNKKQKIDNNNAAINTCSEVTDFQEANKSTKTVSSQNSAIPSAQPEEPKQSLKLENHKVAGTSYRQAEIRDMGFENGDYNLPKDELECLYSEYEKIYALEFYPDKVELVEEPDNPHDTNAIKVIIDNVHVGYIKRGSCSHIKKLINRDMIQSITAIITGGKYKRLVPDDDVYDSYFLERDSSNFFITLQLEITPDKPTSTNQNPKGAVLILNEKELLSLNNADFVKYAKMIAGNAQQLKIDVNSEEYKKGINLIQKELKRRRKQ